MKGLIIIMKTQRELVNAACKNKGITVKKMCDDLGINYDTYKSSIRRNPLGGQRYLAIAKYLDLDLMELMSAPFDKPLIKKESK